MRERGGEVWMASLRGRGGFEREDMCMVMRVYHD
jgi:hypothetical protein